MRPGGVVALGLRPSAVSVCSVCQQADPCPGVTFVMDCVCVCVWARQKGLPFRGKCAHHFSS